ncbi:hypothetical protein [Streptomyces sp. UNOC14_S4]|uniref:hypothetical protein n=1 Tax=Streptomyces sp. UNOC14_S4 TaxID=2872340 RepID=UPI001E5E8D10|nr:hypothetical protein [Streptomyces sp. UNOC14_S4]MCC3766668.1 hypothetical protein [Streptomyces sp. UNOC14_S4]
MTYLPRPVIDAMAERAMRMHHMLWHVSRNEWEGLTEAQRQVFRDHGWDPPRPSLTAGPTPRPELDNGSGEDFLYMHRQMIAEVDAILARVQDPHYPRVVGWEHIPAPGDAEYPVPPAYTVPDDAATTAAIARSKNAAAYTQIQQWEAGFTDPAALRGTTLGHLGASIEFTIHNRMHLRWSAAMPAYRPDGDPFGVDPRWDAPGYDWLADFYSSHVNPVFWKLHGWVDARIDAWMAANHHTGPVPWSYDPPWTGPMPMPMPRADAERLAADLKRADVRVRKPFFPVIEP